jgi:predicted AlkP superfamily pyrophosphatase or phosphodiesterase
VTFLAETPKPDPRHTRIFFTFMPRAAILNVVGLTPRHITEHTTPKIFAWMKRRPGTVIQPQVPAVTCTMQATLMTGKRPSEHGIVANGWYNRELSEVHMWKQSNHLVKGETLIRRLHREIPGYTVAKTFWWYNMYSGADFSITPRPMYPADGRKIFDIYTHPPEIREQIKKDLGPFPFPAFWGPAAGLPSTQWIAASAKWIEEKHSPHAHFVYLPHLDYNFQRYGPDDGRVAKDLQEIDGIVGDLLDFFSSRKVKVVLLSEYGITKVDQPIHLNRVFREQGWLVLREELGKELLDCGASKAFAMADHQVAHIYVNDPTILPQVRTLVENTPGVSEVMDNVLKRVEGLDHGRSGDLVAVSDARSWFTYYYWQDDRRAPDFARCVDIHRKPGYDPVELFLDPKLKFPKVKIVGKLAKKKLGMRMLMDVVPLEAELVRGSHGRVPEDQADWPVLVGDLPGLADLESVKAVDVYSLLHGLLIKARG